MKSVLIYKVLILMILQFTFLKIKGQDTVIYEHINFLKKEHLSSVDYILHKFKSFDIVVLCERHHAEMTQYNMIFDLIKNSSFIENVGNVITEIGCSNYTDTLNSVLSNNEYSKKESEKLILEIYKDFDWTPIWEKRNMYLFLKELYKINSKLKKSNKVKIFLSDLPFSWNGMTKEKYENFNKNNNLTIRYADSIIGNQVISSINKIIKNETNKKALVIMNYRHAIPYECNDGQENVGHVIKKAFGKGRVCFLLINQILEDYDMQKSKYGSYSQQSGKWDASFDLAEKNNVGFDLVNTPFGNDNFDLMPFCISKEKKYSDIFDGLVYFGFPREHNLIWYIPEAFDDSFTKEFIRRAKIMGADDEQINKVVKVYSSSILEEKYRTLKIIEKEISKWK